MFSWRICFVIINFISKHFKVKLLKFCCIQRHLLSNSETNPHAKIFNRGRKLQRYINLHRQSKLCLIPIAVGHKIFSAALPRNNITKIFRTPSVGEIGISLSRNNEREVCVYILLNYFRLLLQRVSKGRRIDRSSPANSRANWHLAFEKRTTQVASACSAFSLSKN